jgi:hypothetical protein
MLKKGNSVAIDAKSNRIYNARVKVFPCVLQEPQDFLKQKLQH